MHVSTTRGIGVFSLTQPGWELQHVPTGVNRDSQGAPQERV
jgi:hypothetical protein